MFRNFFRATTTRFSNTPRKANRRNRRLLRMESMEDRRLMAVVGPINEATEELAIVATDTDNANPASPADDGNILNDGGTLNVNNGPLEAQNVDAVFIDRHVDIITSPAASGGPHVKVFNGSTQFEFARFTPYDQGFTGGVFVAAGDINGDGLVVGTDAGGGPHVIVFDANPVDASQHFFTAYPGFTGGVRVGVADVNDDGQVEVITAAGPGGGPHVRVFNGDTGTATDGFFAFDPTFTGGVFVAAGDVSDDGLAVGPDAGGGPHIIVFDANQGDTTQPGNFFAFDAGFTGGVRVAVGDVNGDGLNDIITGAGPGGGPHVKVFDGLTDAAIAEFIAYNPTFLGGVRVAAGDVNG